MPISYSTLGWCFAISVTLHNVEEAVFLPAWSRRAREGRCTRAGARPLERGGGEGRCTRAGVSLPVVGEFEFRFAVVVLTLLAWLVAGLAARAGPQSLAAHLLGGYACAMLLNVVVPHLLASLVFRELAPGTLTALAFNLPVCSALLRVGFHDRAIDFDRMIWAGPLCVVVLVGMIPILFRIGRALDSMRASAIGRED